MLLLIETSTEVCSVALADGGKVIGLCESVDPHAHSQRLTVFIQQLLQEAGVSINELDGVAISAGPGSYTGLRIGISTAKGLCFSLGIPLLAVSTLDALAWASLKDHGGAGVYHCPMIEARRMEVWCKLYNEDMIPLSETAPHILTGNSFEDILSAGHKICFSGNGVPKAQGIITHPAAIFSNIRCSAAHMGSLAEKAFQERVFEDLAYSEPVYLKPPNITVSPIS